MKSVLFKKAAKVISKEGEGTCKEHVPLGIVEQDIAAVHGHTLQAEEDDGHARYMPR